MEQNSNPQMNNANPVNQDASINPQPNSMQTDMGATSMPANSGVTNNPLPPLNQPQNLNSNSNATERTFKILVVDDEPDALTIFQDTLTSVPNYEVSTAVDGVDALAKAEATKFDLILLDIVMPVKDGVQTLSELKQFPDKYGTPRVLMLTNIGGDLAIEEALKLGAVGYKLKTETEPEDLLKIVAEELSKV